MLRHHPAARSFFGALRSRACIAVIALLVGTGSALADKGLVIGAEMQGFGRMVFSFPTELKARARVVSSVLVVEFDRPVQVDLEKLSQQLPNYVAVARSDPDGKSLRFGLNDRFKVDLKLAGERIYLDVLPPRWQGLPPSLPAEVVQDLVRRARQAEDQLKRLARETEKPTNRALELRMGTAPQFKRAVFVMPRTAPATYDTRDGQIALNFEANFTIEPDVVRAKLAGLVRDIAVDAADDNLRILMKPADGLTVRGFREDDTLILDFARADGAPIEADAASSAPAKPEAAPASAKPGEAMAKPESDRMMADMPAADGGAAAIARPAPARPAIETMVEAGFDKEGFALRLGQLGDAPVAIVQRDRGLLVLVETPEALNLPSVPPELTRNIEGLSLQRVKGGTVITIVPAKPGRFWLTRDATDIVIQRGKTEGGAEAFSGSAIVPRRGFDANGREALEAPVGKMGQLFVIDDPATGQRLALVPAPRAEFVSPKGTAFAEFAIEPTLAGFAALQLDDAVTFRREPETLVIGHEIKLNLSNLPPETAAEPDQKRPLILDLGAWSEDSRPEFRAREREFSRLAAESAKVSRTDSRIRLAKFYLANAFYPEAASVLNVTADDDPAAAASKPVVFLRALTAAMMGRLVEANRFLVDPALGNEGEQKLLQAVVDAKSMRYPQANAGFRQSMAEMERYPEALQSLFRPLAISAAIEAQDPVAARDQLLAYEKLDQAFRDPTLQQLLAGRLAESQGRYSDAVSGYALASQSRDRRIEAEARFGKASAALADGKLSVEEARNEFETLSTIWRRSEVEVKSLERLSEIYSGEGRWREAFLAAQRATAILPDHPATRRMEEAMGRRFENLFLDKEADKLSKVESLAIYQEFRSLVPVGRRGDEVARRLADRLYDLDLVGEAAEILEHQVKNRLDGAARSTVATRLAVMYLQGRQPAKALNILRTTRLAGLPEDLRRARSLLEARALGDLFRTELAIEILANDKGEDVDRLRADIYWKGKKWREAGESYERVLGDAWQKDAALSEEQRLDALRAGLAYVLGEEKLSLDRLRSRYLAAMAKTDDSGAFSLITNEKITKPEAFRDAARAVVNADTLTDFMAAYRKRYPDTGGSARPGRSAGDPRQSALDSGVRQNNQPIPGSG